jgi:hypothetical protein
VDEEEVDRMGPAEPFDLVARVVVRIPGQVGRRFQSKLATDSGMKLATYSDAMLATSGSAPEWVANISPE